MTFQIRDCVTGEVLGKVYTSQRKANAVADRKNLMYGAHRYSVKSL